MSLVDRGLKIIAALPALFAASAAADSWLAPTEQDYYSADEAYYLHVVPGDGDKHAAGTLYEVVVDAAAGGDALLKWSRDLLNPYAPHKVLVADSGEYVVTFDEWGGVGYGPNVVVIYGPGGDVVRNFALEELLTEEDIADVPTTVSSRWWGGEHYLDEEAGEVVLKVVAGGMMEEMKARTRDLRVALADGEVLP
jgi:hypothetical protein